MTSGNKQPPPTPAPDPHVRADMARDVFFSTEQILRRGFAIVRRSAEARHSQFENRRYASAYQAPRFPQDGDSPESLQNARRPVTMDFLESLDPTQRQAFISTVHEMTFVSGATLMQEGEPADYVIVLRSGWTRVAVRQGSGERTVAECGPGQLLGERGALRVSVRSASVTALSAVSGLAMKTVDFASFIEAHPSVLDIVEGQIYDRLTRDPVEHKRRFLSGDLAAQAISVAPVTGSQPVLKGENCTVLCTDVVGFGAPARNDHDRQIVRRASRAMVQESLGRIWDESVIVDRGDGLLIVVPPTITTSRIVRELHRELPGRLRTHNETYREPAHVRLRLAVIVGPVTSDDFGISGDATAVKRAMTETGASLGLIASEFVYDTAIRDSSELKAISEYKPIRIKVKETSVPGWLQLFGQASPEFQLQAQ